MNLGDKFLPPLISGKGQDPQTMVGHWTHEVAGSISWRLASMPTKLEASPRYADSTGTAHVEASGRGHEGCVKTRQDKIRENLTTTQDRSGMKKAHQVEKILGTPAGCPWNTHEKRG